MNKDYKLSNAFNLCACVHCFRGCLEYIYYSILIDASSHLPCRLCFLLPRLMFFNYFSFLGPTTLAVLVKQKVLFFFIFIFLRWCIYINCIHSFISNLSDDRSTAFSKTLPPSNDSILSCPQGLPATSYVFFLVFLSLLSAPLSFLQ